ncbi:MAG: hypothetical protein J6U88_01610 [Bacteroidales bacterium]|nr:hypothetical protein [Bacteroidales bacterium]
MHRYIRNIIVALIGVLLGFAPLKGQELLSSTFSRDTILIGDQVEWGARVNVPKDITIWVDSLLNPVVPGVELISDYTFDTLNGKRNRYEIDMRAIITSFDSGSYYLPRQVLYFYKGEELVDTIVINERTLEVTTVPIDTATYQMYDIKGPITYPVTFGEVIPWIALGLAILALGYMVFRMIRNRRENKSLLGKPIVKDPPHITALRSLESIREKKLWQNHQQKEYYTEITDTIREYIEGRYSIPTFEKTTSEIVAELEALDISGQEWNELKEMFGVADLVKFAKYSATEGENERAIPVAVRFVNATYMTKLEEEQSNG